MGADDRRYEYSAIDSGAGGRPTTHYAPPVRASERSGMGMGMGMGEDLDNDGFYGAGSSRRGMGDEGVMRQGRVKNGNKDVKEWYV